MRVKLKLLLLLFVIVKRSNAVIVASGIGPIENLGVTVAQ